MAAAMEALRDEREQVMGVVEAALKGEREIMTEARRNPTQWEIMTAAAQRDTASILTLVEASAAPGFDWSIKRVQIEAEITPEICMAWKEAGRCVMNYRKLKQSTVIRYATDIDERIWRPNGEPMIFDCAGNMHDGQHRREACILAGKSFTSDVRFGVDPQTAYTNDTGSGRTAQSVAAHEGVRHYSFCSTAARTLWGCERNGPGYRSGRNQPSNAQVVEYVRQHRAQLEQAADMVMGASRIGPGGLFTACAFQFAAQNHELAVRFFRDLSTGIQLSETNPVYHLLRRMLDNRRSKSKLAYYEVFALTRISWNAYRAGKEMRVLRWRSDGPHPEPFPEI